MIQPVAPKLTVDLSQIAGKAAGSVPDAAEIGSFSAILDETGEAVASMEGALPAIEDALAGFLKPIASGTSGKQGGKMLPELAANISSGFEADKVVTAEDPEIDPTVFPLALVGLLPFPAALQPQPLAATPVRYQAATDGSAAIPVAGPNFASSLSPAPSPTIPASSPFAQNTIAANMTRLGRDAAAGTLASMDAILVTSDNTSETGKSAVDEKATFTISAQLASRSLPGKAQDLAVAGAKVDTSLAAGPQAEKTVAINAAAGLVDSDANPAAGTEGAPQIPSSARQNREFSAAEQPSPRQPAAKLDALATTPPQLQQAQQAQAPFPVTTDALQAQTPAATPLSTESASPAKAEGPQDFATLVSRLAEAREAATPQLVRTAIAHPEFGRISLQFRHEDNAMSVTMANSDPGFASAVQAATNASLAGDSSKDGKDSSHQQHTQSTSQQQASAGGAGAGAGNNAGQQQTRADQANQSMNRGRGSAPGPDQQEGSAPGRGGNVSRQGSGVYA